MVGFKLISFRVIRWNCCNQENEKEVLKMGSVHLLERDPIINETIASKYRPALRSNSGKEHTALRLWIFGYERVLTNERAQKTISRALHPKYHVLSTAGTNLHA